MELHLTTSPQQSEEQKENASNIMIKLYRKKKPEARASSFSTQNRCRECDMLFNSTEVLFGHSMIHQKSNRESKKMAFLGLRETKHVDVMAACILMGIRRSKCEKDIDDAKRSKLKWICAKIERQMKKTKEVVSLALAAVGAGEVEMHRCDKCAKVFNSGQALGGHKRAHYTGPPLCRPGKQRKFIDDSGGGGRDLQP